jgi:hypothetical protein
VTRQNLRDLGLDNNAVTRLLRERDATPFADVGDLQNRARLTPEQVRVLTDFLVIGRTNA